MQTFTPIEYLKIDIANSAGMDKSSWQERIEWFEAREAALLELFSDENDDRKAERKKVLRDQDEPALFYAGLKAYMAALDGKAIDYPISLDATASGAQLLSVLIGCEKSARLCNVVPTGHREDLYTNVFNMMRGRLGDAAGTIQRKDAKTAVMTSLYSSTAEPERVFGTGDKLDTFYAVMEEEATGIWKLNKALIKLWRPENSVNEWMLPDGFNVKIKVMDKEITDVVFLDETYEITRNVNQPTKTGRSISANLVHSLDGMVVREILRRCYHNADQLAKVEELCLRHSDRTKRMFADQAKTHNERMVAMLAKAYDQSGFLSARILDFIDDSSILFAPTGAVWALLDSVPSKSFPVITVHDCFRVHPNYANDLRQQYRTILAEIAESKMLDYLASQIAGVQLETPKIDDIASKVREAEYALS